MNYNIRLYDVYTKKRYWYHLSSTLTLKKEILNPRDNDEGFNRADHEPNIKRICVSPSLEQCLTAIPYSKRDTYLIYRTTKQLIANKPHDIFDFKITNEGWILVTTSFTRLGTLDMDVMRNMGIKIITESATGGCTDLSRKVFKWWKKINPWKYVTRL